MVVPNIKIGLEVHVQLTTRTKLFCGCPRISGDEPNTTTCPVCLGLPGSKPVVNGHAIDDALKIGLALNCSFPEETFFSRKSYFYPDMAKNFQITQYEIPFAKGGLLVVNDKKYRIRRIQLEEDPARIVHSGTITDSKYVLVDYNRSGVPLCEIVTEPDFTSTNEVRLFLQELSTILQYLDVFDPNIEGSMRADANVSISGHERVEIKNITGFREVERALDYEITRQSEAVENDEKIVQETRTWDAEAAVTRSLRTKEMEEEYGYIFEPDLPRITISQKMISAAMNSMPEMPSKKLERYVNALGIDRELAFSITREPGLADAFERVSEKVDMKLAARWFAGKIKKTLNYNNLRLKDTKIKAEHITKLLEGIERKSITEQVAESIFRKMITEPDAVSEADDMARIFDEKKLEPHVDRVIQTNIKAVLDLKSGNTSAFEFLVGQVMRETKGRGDPSVIRALLRRKLE